MGKSTRDIKHNECKRRQREGDFGSIDCVTCRGCPIRGNQNSQRKKFVTRQIRAKAKDALIQGKDIPVVKRDYID